MNTRDEQIAKIRGATDHVEDRERLEECYDQVIEAYESASIIEQLARVVELEDRTPSDFHVLTLNDARKLTHFNDPSYHWDFFCSQLGRAIASAEKRHFFEAIRGIDPEGSPVSVEAPSFSELDVAVRFLQERGVQPDTVCAPIGLYVPFGGSKEHQIDWSASPREVLVLPSGVRLKLIWSHGGAPLDRFVVFDSRFAVWKVKLDSESGHRLTVAIGEQIVAGERGLVFLAETVAKCEIEDSRAFYAIPLDGEPLDPEEYVNRGIFQEMNNG